MTCFRLAFGASLLLSGVMVMSGAGSENDADRDAAQQVFRTDLQPFLSKYCADCHGGDEPEADLKLDALGETVSINDDRERWESIFEMVRMGEMPPEGEPQPDADESKKFTDWLGTELANIDWSQHHHPGRVTIRRLNRTEYDNTIRDLFGIDFQPAEEFPADDVGHGFDNIGDVLSVSPILMEKYLAAADEIVRRAMADPVVRGQIITSWPSDTKSRDKCASEVLTRFASRAFRRPVTDAEIDRLMQLVRAAAAQGADYQQCLELALQAVLASPQFLFRPELDDDLDDLSRQRPINDYELATRLSYFLWSSMPDDELFSLAKAGKLKDERVLTAQVRRMLQDSKSAALVDCFAGQWLELRNLDKLAPDPDKYRAFDEELRQAMVGETRRFFETVMREDRDILEFIDSDYTFVNERLARHYGLDGIDGEHMRKVRLDDDRRGGVLTQASILTLTSNPTRTSPVKRGKWILDNILGTPPPPPPPGVLDLEESEEAELLGSLRERMEQHRADPTCAVCHRKMDALGFGFENFDGIGAWRELDGRFKIDPAGELPGDQQFSGPGELRGILKSERRNEFVRCFCQKMLTYALGRGLETYDRVTVDQIVAEAEQNDRRFSSVILAVVKSDPFLLRGSKGDDK